jgi:hypothetical protein
VEAPQPLEPRFERGLGFAAAGVPALEVRENGDELDDRMRGRIVELHRPGALRLLFQQRGEVQPEDLVGLRRAPAGRIGEQRDVEVRQRVAERAADVVGIVVDLDKLREALDRVLTEGVALLPEHEVRSGGLAVDLLARPGLEVDLARGFDALALLDLPGVRPCVVDECLRVEELERRARGKVRGPRLVLEKPHRALGAVKTHLELCGADQGFRPLRGVLRLLRRPEDRLDAVERLLELLLRNERVDLFPCMRKRGRRRGRRSHRRSDRGLLLGAGRGVSGEQQDTREQDSGADSSSGRTHDRHSA